MPADEGKSQPSRKGTVALTVHVDPDLRHSVKKLALEERTTVQDLVERTLQDLVSGKKRGKAKL